MLLNKGNYKQLDRQTKLYYNNTISVVKNINVGTEFKNSTYLKIGGLTPKGPLFQPTYSNDIHSVVDNKDRNYFLGDSCN